MTNVGRCLLPELLRKKGWTQQELADRTKIKYQRISDYATNRTIMSLKNAMIIANAIGCKIDDLYTYPLFKEWK